MSTLTKKSWQSIAANAADEIEHLEWEVRDARKEILQRIENTKSIIDWSWDTCKGENGQTAAVYWDDANDDEKAMLDQYAKFDDIWFDARKKLEQARVLLEEAYTSLNSIR